MRLLISIVLAATLGACAAEEAAPPFPYFEEEGGRVRDLAGILDGHFEADLTATLDAAEADYGYQMAVVTVPSLHGYAVADFANAYANEWGLGDPRRNDGLLVLVAPSERQVRIEVGRGIEDAFTDLFCAAVLEEQMLPRFREGDYASGIASGTGALIERMRANAAGVPANDNGAEDDGSEIAA